MGGSSASSDVSSGATSTSNSDRGVGQKNAAPTEEQTHAARSRGARRNPRGRATRGTGRSEADPEARAPADAVGDADAPRDRSPSSSSEEDSDRSRKKRRKKEKGEKKDESLKVKRKKKSKSKDKDKKKKRKTDSKDKGPVQLSQHIYADGQKYSVISGKKIRLKIDKTKEDIEAEQKRKDLLASLNELYD